MASKGIVLGAILVVLIWTISQFNIARVNPIQDAKQLAFVGAIEPGNIIKHTENLISIGNSDFVYETTRSKAREYVRDELVKRGIPQELIVWHRFEWQEKKADGRNITTTTWTGINIVVWTNSTEIPGQKVRIFGAHYDTVHWGANSTSGAHDNLAGTGLLIELTANIYKYQKNKASTKEQEIPYLIVFFDHEEPGALGSKTFTDYYKISKNSNNIAYFVDVDSLGYSGASPLLQTYPYEDKGMTYYSPNWLVSLMLQSAFYATIDGMMVGHPGFFSSIGYQGSRYHLMSIPYLSDDGPFTWAGVASLLVTDLDIFWRETNPDYHKITDQPQNLDNDLLQQFSQILSYFTIVTEDDSYLVSPQPTPVTMGAKLQANIIKFVQSTILAGCDQYLALGPFSFGFWELSSFSLFMLYVIYQSSFKAYRDLCKSVIQAGVSLNPVAKLVNHRLLFFQLAFLTVTVLIDTIPAFIMISLGFVALVSIHRQHFNIVAAMLCCALCANFLMMDFTQMSDLGRRGRQFKEVKLAFVLTVYSAHTFGVLFYGADYYIKSKLKIHPE